MKGKDVQGASFVGVAFHGIDGTTYDAIYFRPFNFKTKTRHVSFAPCNTSPIPHIHGRSCELNSPARTKSPSTRAGSEQLVPCPGSCREPEGSVFVGEGKEPCLTVNQLSDRKKGLVGIWVGNTSGGDFANFTIVPG